MSSYNYKNFTIHHYQELESTNQTAFALADLRKISAGEIILADKQSKGRGRNQRNWASPQGNLYFSLVLQPKVAVSQVTQLSFIGILALKIAIEKNLTNKVKVKWPNDLIINDKKCAGLLLESKISQQNVEFVVMGIGVNIVSNPDDVIFPATNLKDFSLDVSTKELLENFLNEFDLLYQNWLNFGFFAIRKLWLQSAWRLHEEITVKTNEKAITGIFSDLDGEGNLMLKTGSTLNTICLGDVISL